MMNNVKLTATAAAAAVLAVAAAVLPGAVPAQASTLPSQWHTAYHLGIRGGLLTGIMAPAASAVWVTGLNRSGTGFLLHWNGHRWRLGNMPVPGFHVAAIASSSPRNVWMFGWTTEPVALRWNGKSWHRISWPGVVGLGPQGLSVLAWNNVWISEGQQPQHWNGHSWTTVTMPAGCGDEQIGAASTTDVWTVNVPDGPTAQKFVACQWNGRNWRRVEVPHTGETRFVRLLVVSSASVWVAGQGSTRSLVWHLSGHSWHVMTDAGAGDVLVALASYGTSGLWTGEHDVWTGRAWIHPTGPGHLTAYALTSVPRSAQAWLVGSDQAGQVVLRVS